MDIHSIKVACSSCNLRELCMPAGLSPDEMSRLDSVISTRKRIKRGQSLFNNGERFTSLYAVRSGFFKTCVTSADGRDQVTGFQMTGEILGMDGIVNDHHSCDAVALEDAEVCVLPFDRIESLSREFSALQHHVHKIMSREIVREHGVMLLPSSSMTPCANTASCCCWAACGPRSAWRPSCSTWYSDCTRAASRSRNWCCA